MAGWSAWSLGKRSPAITLDAHESRATVEINILDRNKVEKGHKHRLHNFEHETQSSALTEHNR